MINILPAMHDIRLKTTELHGAEKLTHPPTPAALRPASCYLSLFEGYLKLNRVFSL